MGAPCPGRAPQDSPAGGSAPPWGPWHGHSVLGTLLALLLSKRQEMTPHWCEGWLRGVERDFLAAKEGTGVSREMASPV